MLRARSLKQGGGSAGTATRLAAAMLTAVAVMGSWTTPAMGTKVKRTVVVHWRDVLENNGTTTSWDTRSWSKSRYCDDAPRKRWQVRFRVSFAAGVDGPYPDPAAQAQDDGGDGEFLPQSAWLPAEKVGENHHRWEFANSFTFRTTNPNGTYGGTYPISYWWAAMGNSYWGFSGGPHSDWTSREIHTRRPHQVGHFEGNNKIRVKKKGVVHVIRCLEANAKYDYQVPPWPEDTAGVYTAAPVPSKVVWGG